MDLQSLALSVAIDCSTFSPVDNGETSALRYLFLRDDAILTPDCYFLCGRKRQSVYSDKNFQLQNFP